MILTELDVSNMDVQQALSEKYGPNVCLILELDSGKIAVFTPGGRELVALVDTWDEIKQVDLTTSSQLQKELRWRSENRRKPLKVKREREQPRYKPPTFDRDKFSQRMEEWKAKRAK